MRRQFLAPGNAGQDRDRAHSGSPTGSVIQKLDPVKLTEKQRIERGGLSGMVSRNESLDGSSRRSRAKARHIPGPGFAPWPES